MESVTYQAKIDSLTREILAELGIKHPTGKQKELIKVLLTKTIISIPLVFQHTLTPREIFCLQFAAQGKSVKETAEALNIKPFTVKFYRQQVLQKLQCKTIAEAVFQGMRFGCFLDKQFNNSTMAEEISNT